MKFFISILISSIFIFIASAQNLVPNPSFEDTIVCPNGFSQMHKALSWSSYRPTPDFFHSCSSSPDISVPQNNMGYQFPAHNMCNSYAGIYTYVQGLNYRECFGSQLLKSLEVGQKYYVSFKVSLANTVNCGTNKLGVLFSTISFNDSTPVSLNNYAHVYSTQVITDTSIWNSVVGSFIADSSYQYIIVGNFFDNSNTDTTKFNSLNCTSYYFIDDICVSSDSSVCGSFTFICNNGIVESGMDNTIRIFPNPTDEKINIDIFESKATLEVYNSLGSLVISQELFEGNNFLNHTLSSGIYFFYVIAGDKILTKKIILT